MKKPKKIILDGDIIAWKAAFVAEKEGVMSIDGLVEGLVDKWTPDDVDTVQIAISCTADTNFRRTIYPGYKENRVDVYKPEFLGDVFVALNTRHDCLMYPTLEADDILGIHASSGDAISVSLDKDLKGVHGWYYNPDKNDEPYYITKEEAELWFCTQWMTGDTTDGIPGLWRIGVKTAKKLLDEWETDEWHKNIQEMYAEGKHSPENKYEVDDMALAMARCVRILQDGNYDIETKEITLWNPKLGYKKEQEI